MEILIFVTGIALTYFLVIYPCWCAQMDRTKREFDEVYHAFKLRMIRRCYPDIRHLSFAEIEEQYDVDGSFDNIGLFAVKARDPRYFH